MEPELINGKWYNLSGFVFITGVEDLNPFQYQGVVNGEHRFWSPSEWSKSSNFYEGTTQVVRTDWLDDFVKQGTMNIEPYLTAAEAEAAAVPDTQYSYQVDGDHYQMPIQPTDFIVKNNIPWREGNVIKYVVRHHRKNGAVDIQKAIHYLEMILEDYEEEADDDVH
jgi:hypothetical protein